jgi:hypothetical protein
MPVGAHSHSPTSQRIRLSFPSSGACSTRRQSDFVVNWLEKLIIHLLRRKVPLLRKDKFVVDFRLPHSVIDSFFSVLSGFRMRRAARLQGYSLLLCERIELRSLRTLWPCSKGLCFGCSIWLALAIVVFARRTSF